MTLLRPRFELCKETLDASYLCPFSMVCNKSRKFGRVRERVARRSPILPGSEPVAEVQRSRSFLYFPGRRYRHSALQLTEKAK